MNDADFTIHLSNYHKPNQNETKDEKNEQLQVNLLRLKRPWIFQVRKILRTLHDLDSRNILNFHC